MRIDELEVEKRTVLSIIANEEEPSYVEERLLSIINRALRKDPEGKRLIVDVEMGQAGGVGLISLNYPKLK